MSRNRIKVLAVLFFISFSAILFRAFQLQIMPQQRIENLAHRQLKKRFEVRGRRGVIVDRSGRELAVSANSVSIYANPILIKDPLSLSKTLAYVLKSDYRTIFEKIHVKGKRFVWIARQLDSESLKRLEKTQLAKAPGLGIVPEFKRFYPSGNLAAQVLGFINIDGDGLSGIEKTFDAQLKGPRNSLHVGRDAWGRPVFGQEEQLKLELMTGEKVELSIDANLQFSTEKALREAVEKHKALGGVAVVMNPWTGEILAMANVPTFNPNQPSHSRPESRRNNVVTNPIEPGSVMKPFVVAKALEMKAVTPQSRISAGDGQVKVGQKIISEADAKHRFKDVSMTDLIRFSSNVGVVKLQQKIGYMAVVDAFRSLGFGTRTGLETSGESAGIFRTPKPHQILEQATMSFGQGIAATPIQVVTAFSTLANGGFKIQPTLLKKKSEEIQALAPQRIFSEKTTAAMRKIMEQVVEMEGTGTLAKVQGFKAAGKTGTSQKVDFERGGYKRGAYWASFAGFIPSDKPRFVIYVMIDEPSEQSYYGGVVAAPVFSSIARTAIRQVVSPSPQLASASGGAKKFPFESSVEASLIQNHQVKMSNQMPDLRGLPLKQAMEGLAAIGGAKVEILSVGRWVQEQVPSPGEQLEKNRQIYLKLR